MKFLLFFGIAAVLCMIALLIFAGCKNKGNILDGPGMVNSYTVISQEEAKRMMKADDGHIIVDVRRHDEFDAGHIPGAICIPNESILDTEPKELPDKNQIILIYCRSGRRSKEAAEKLFGMGYRKVFEFGGIIDWTGETVVGSTADDDIAQAISPVPVLVVDTGKKILYASLEDNPSAKEFIEKLSPARISVDMQDYGDFEKVGVLPWEIAGSDEEITTAPGDIILYQGNKITLYYDENTYRFTRLARIGNVTKEELISVLGDGDVTIGFWLEWSE